MRFACAFAGNDPKTGSGPTKVGAVALYAFEWAEKIKPLSRRTLTAQVVCLCGINDEQFSTRVDEERRHSSGIAPHIEPSAPELRKCVAYRLHGSPRACVFAEVLRLTQPGHDSKSH